MRIAPEPSARRAGRSVRAVFAVFAVALAAGCAAQVDPGASVGPADAAVFTLDGGLPSVPVGIPGLVSIAVEPADQMLTIDGDTPATATYKAIGTFTGGKTEDITFKVGFRLADGTLGAFTGAQLTSTVARGGRTEVIAAAGAVEGRARLALFVRKRAVDPMSQGVPPDPASRFGGASAPARAPELVYPGDGVVLPPNLGRLELHFLPGAGNTLFELGFASALTDVRIYARCTQPMKGGCIFSLAGKLWDWIGPANRGGEPLRVTVRGTDDAGAGVGSSAPLAMSFTSEDVQGAVYYWTTSGGSGIMRYDFASNQVMAEKYLGTELSGGTCIGCHALSREGNKMIASAGTPMRGQMLLMDVARKQPIVQFPPTPRSLFASWGPGDKQFVGVWGELDAADFNLLLFDGNTGQLTGRIDVGGSAQNPTTHPDWSPDGLHIAYTRVGEPFLRDGLPRIQEEFSGSIAMVDATASGWSPPVTLVPQEAGKNRYYPAFAPDSSFLVYTESTCAPDDPTRVLCDAEVDPSARLWAVRLAPGSKPVELAAANAPGKLDQGAPGLTTTFAKWNPFQFKRAAADGKGRLGWVTFSSTRKYGLRDPPPPSELDSIGSLFIWMSAVDLDGVAAGKDPSAPAFVLPFQDITTSNHIAQWTKRFAVVE